MGEYCAVLGCYAAFSCKMTKKSAVLIYFVAEASHHAQRLGIPLMLLFHVRPADQLATFVAVGRKSARRPCFKGFCLIELRVCLRRDMVAAPETLAENPVRWTYLAVWIWSDFDRASSLICGNEMPTRCSRWFLLQISLSSTPYRQLENQNTKYHRQQPSV